MINTCIQCAQPAEIDFTNQKCYGILLPTSHACNKCAGKLIAHLQVFITSCDLMGVPFEKTSLGIKAFYEDGKLYAAKE